MDLERELFKDLTEALTHAFTDDELRRVVRFSLGENMNDHIEPGGMKKRVFDLLEWAQRGGRVDELLAGAVEERGNNPKLRAFVKEYASELLKAHQTAAEAVSKLDFKSSESPDADAVRKHYAELGVDGGLQAAITTLGVETGQDVVAWARATKQIKQQVCSIGNNGDHYGTGFLVGDRIVMTAAHVVPADPKTLDVAFDFVGEDSRRRKLPKIGVVTELFRSEPEELDVSILELGSPPSGARGRLRPTPHTFGEIRQPVIVFGHPDGLPLRQAMGVVFDYNPQVSRVAYTANTAPGSSGSPVLTLEWDLVALHHHGTANVNNHGVPMKSILAHPEVQKILP